VSREIKRTTTRWARLSVGYYRDPKLIEVGPIGEAAFLRLLALAREVVETVEIDGAVSYVLAGRELREITDLYTTVNPGKAFDDLLEELSDVGLVHRDGKFIILTNYGEWQTTRSEIDAAREENRNRVAAYRARKAAGKTDNPGGEDEEMGVYDNSVEAFADLRESGAIKKGSRKVGKHGLLPNQVEDAERIVTHLETVRKEVLGGNFKITPAWWSDVKKLLSGSGENGGLTADQVCDLIDFALHHKFWHSHCQTPAGLAKHGQKLFTSDEYITWSLRNKRPEANRPRNTLIGEAGPSTFRGNLAADKTVDWSKVSEEL
jgi:hypothetical protein